MVLALPAYFPRGGVHPGGAERGAVRVLADGGTSMLVRAARMDGWMALPISASSPSFVPL
jgi:hypothetical protein